MVFTVHFLRALWVLVSDVEAIKERAAACLRAVESMEADIKVAHIPDFPSPESVWASLSALSP